MTVAVSSGTAYVTGTPSGQNSQTLRVKNSASSNVTISANSSGSTKYDYIYISLSAANMANPNTAADNVATLVASRSSNSSTDDGTPPTYGYLLAVVTVANGASSITNGNIADKRTTTGATPGDATILPYHFVGQSAKGGSEASSWAWQSWTPTWTNLTVGAGGTVTAKYLQIGKFVYCDLGFVLGTGSSVSGLITFTLPVTAASRYTNKFPLGHCYYEDSGVAGYMGHVQANNTTTAVLIYHVASTTNVTVAGTSGTAPFSFGSADFFYATFRYEAA